MLLPLQFCTRRSVSETAKFESAMACWPILAERLRESGVKLAKEMSCQMQGMAKRKLHCFAMKHTGSIVKTL